MTMRWRRLGVVYRPDGSQPWARSHAMLPTPVLRGTDALRIYYSACDADGAGRPAWVDVDPADPTRVLRACRAPLLDLGRPGAFDDNGVVATSVVPLDERTWFMYYVGFELCRKVRYRLFTGLAVSEDGGDSFRRVQATPVLDRSPEEQQFRCGPHVVRAADRFRMWYVAGSEWTQVDGKAVPVYTMKYLESVDGIRWPDRGESALELADVDEHGFGRPWVVAAPQGGYELYYSIRRRSLAAYRLGYATSADGRAWRRRDAELGLDVAASGWDSEAIMYAAVVRAAGHTYCFYNGNGFGATGFGVALREGTR
jgi:hypothetical protein